MTPDLSFAEAASTTSWDLLSASTATMALFLSNFISFLGQINSSMDKEAAEALAGPFFGASLFPYLAFLYFLDRPENECPKGVTVGFATCLLFVFLTIPAAIAAKLLYGVSLADCDWLHGSAESLLTVTNLVTVVAFRQALQAKEQGTPLPVSATSYAPMTWLVVGLTTVATATVLAPALAQPTVHTPYLGGFLDFTVNSWFPEPENALSVPTWIIHVSSLVEFLVAMGFCWRWADVAQNPKWKGLTWGLLPLHSSGVTACVSHLFYNQIPILVPLQAFWTCIGNTTAAIAAYRIAISNGWKASGVLSALSILENFVSADGLGDLPDRTTSESRRRSQKDGQLVGFEDLGQALSSDNDYGFLLRLFVGCTVASYLIKYGETLFEFPLQANLNLALAIIALPSALNAFKWYKRSQDSTFDGWF